VISAIINIAQDVEKDWILEIINHDGKAVNLTMQPGDVVLYESHSVIHGRPYRLQGTYYANLFLHFEPIGYSFELEQKMIDVDKIQVGDNKESEKDNIAVSSRVKMMFERALNVVTNAHSDDTKNSASSGTPFSKLPPHMQEKSLEASRWLQEYVFYRDDSNQLDDVNIVSNKHKKITRTKDESKRTPGATSAHIVAASGNIQGLKEIAATNPKSLNEADSNGWKPLHEVRTIISSYSYLRSRVLSTKNSIIAWNRH
jgi:prolyl 4-hydroxylase